MVSQRRAYVMYRTALRLCEPKIIVIQRAFRAWRQKKHFKMAMKNYKEKEDKIMIIQRAWRKYKAKIDLKSVTNFKNPSLSRVKSDVASYIRKIHELESKIDEMDVKIGLLVRNRITLQDVIKSSNDKENENPTQAQKKNKKHGREKCHSTPQKGLKDLKKDSREKLIAYQHLFYHLQINPCYLSALIYGLPNGPTSKFFEDVLFTLFNYGSNDRDNYLLLNVLKLSLEEEIRNRVMRLSDMISTNPLIIRIIVSLHRKGHGQSKLKEIVGPLIEEVLKDSTLHLNTNPVEIYRNWVNQIEMGTGNASNLPYVVKTEEALQYPEVQSRLNTAVQLLREYADMFCSRIVSSKDLVPYSMRYMAKVMKRSLHKRFPHTQEKDILKAVGNMIYYKYINSAIVAPDAYNIISPSPDKKLTNDQRRNLGIISKILQYSTLKRGFGDESPHLIHLNGFIIDCHEKFKVFVQECCEVEEPEKYYNFNQYTEDTMIFKPTVTMTQQ
ncbi:Ras GTPase-activating-like protein IQGAP2, partial [Armadillidium nasatum]